MQQTGQRKAKVIADKGSAKFRQLVVTNKSVYESSD